MRVRFSSHLFVLLRAFDQSEGDVLEIGTGYYSTSVLSWITTSRRNKLVSYENDQKWIDLITKEELEADRNVRRGEKLLHEIRYIPKCEDVKPDGTHWGVVFIDFDPSEYRKDVALRFKDSADFIVCHDAEPKHDAHYQYSTIYPQFKYVYLDTLHWPNTVVLSNVKEFRP